jgi:phosphate transport system ATP-binding protein
LQIKIQVRDLDLFYGKHQALSGINLDIPANQVMALIGPSGCGKSAFLRVLNRMNDTIEDARVEGSVLLDSENIYSKDIDVVKLRKRVGMVFQKPNPFPMSIFDNIAYGPRIHGLRDRTQLSTVVESSLKQAALWDEVQGRLNQSALSLSGGQQQRLCIARLLAVESEVLLMDEPCCVLDPISTMKIEDLIHQLKEKYTIIMVTHNLQQAGRIADRTAFFLAGQLVEEGPTERIFQRPADSRTEDYITGRFG